MLPPTADRQCFAANFARDSKLLLLLLAVRALRAATYCSEKRLLISPTSAASLDAQADNKYIAAGC